MIRFRHAVILANTKLRSKRGLLFISIVVSSILFTVLIATIIVFTAAQKSAVNFVTKANDGVYRVEVTPVMPSNLYGYDRPLSIETIRHIKEVEKTYYTNLAAKYKAAGLTYDTSTEVSALKPASYFSPSTPVDQRFDIDINSPVIAYDQSLKIDEYAKTAKNTLDDLRRIGEKYDATGYYPSGQTVAAGIPNIMLLKNGKEDFNDTELKNGGSDSYGYITNSIHNGMYQLQDEHLLNRYVLPLSDDKPEGIPVIVTAQELVSLFNKDASIATEPKEPQQKAEWLKKVQEQFKGYTYQACQRNSAELTMIQKIQRDYSDIVNNANNSDFVEPSLQYAYPVDTCGDITVKKDTRTNTEKAADTKLINDQKKLGTYIGPQHRLLTFEVVGVINARPYSQYTNNVQSYLQNLLSADSLNFSASIPLQQYNALPSGMKFIVEPHDVIQQSNALSDAGLTTHVLDFKTVSQARSFIENEACPTNDFDCKKLFTAGPYGSNYLILDEIGKVFNTFMLYSLPIVLGLATIIIWFTMVRVMSESRKETAVYRAMGAKRGDIISIYLIYGMIIAVRIAVTAILLGVSTAYVINDVYGGQLTSIATASFGVINDNARFNLFDVTSPYLLIVIGVIFVVSFLSILQPLLRNVRRSPIEDMRNE